MACARKKTVAYFPTPFTTVLLRCVTVLDQFSLLVIDEAEAEKDLANTELREV